MPRAPPRRAVRGELLGDYPTDKAWPRVGRMLFVDYERLTTRDVWLTKRYRDLCQTEVFPELSDIQRMPAPEKLVDEVDQAYFRLQQDNEIADWFEAEGFDVSKPTIPKEEFEKRLAEHRTKPAEAKRVASANIPKFVSDYRKDNPKPSLRGCRKQWKTLHGSQRRGEVDDEYRKQANKRETSREEGRRPKRAKISVQEN